jgi:Reeler domain
VSLLKFVTFSKYFNLAKFTFFCVAAVSLEGILRASHGLTHKFTGFFLTVERDVTDARILSTKLNEENVGTFHIISHAISKFSDLCPNLVTHANSLPKSDVPVSLMYSININFHEYTIFRVHILLSISL